jgi:hypothetical protein
MGQSPRNAYAVRTNTLLAPSLERTGPEYCKARLSLLPCPLFFLPHCVFFDLHHGDDADKSRSRLEPGRLPRWNWFDGLCQASNFSAMPQYKSTASSSSFFSTNSPLVWAT